MTVSASSARLLSETDNESPESTNLVELRRGGRARAGSYLYEGSQLVTGWHSHDLHQIQYAIGGVVEVETARAHYLLPPQQAAWIPVGLKHQATMTPDVRSVAVMFDPALLPAVDSRARIVMVSPLIRQMMIYALRWPIDRPDSDPVSDGFFRDAGPPRVRGTRSRGAAESAGRRQSDGKRRNGLHEGAFVVGDCR